MDRARQGSSPPQRMERKVALPGLAVSTLDTAPRGMGCMLLALEGRGQVECGIRRKGEHGGGECPGNERMRQQGPPLGVTQQGPRGREHAQPSRAPTSGSAARSGRVPQGALPVPQGVQLGLRGAMPSLVSCRTGDTSGSSQEPGFAESLRQEACRLFCVGKTIPWSLCSSSRTVVLSMLPSPALWPP